jgi:glutathione S-transferase
VIKLYQFDMSPFCHKVRRVLHYKSIPFETVEVSPTRVLTIKKYSPTRKLPCIEYQGRFINDAATVAESESGLRKRLIEWLVPRATLDILSKQGIGRKSELEALEDLHRHFVAIAVALRDSGFLVGDTLTLADISVFVQLDIMSNIPEGKASLTHFPSIIDWMHSVDRLTAG